MKKMLALLFLIGGISHSQAQIGNIVNRESGASTRAKINQSFQDLYALQTEVGGISSAFDVNSDFLLEKDPSNVINMYNGISSLTIIGSDIIVDSPSMHIDSDYIGIGGIKYDIRRYPIFPPFDMLMRWEVKQFIEVIGTASDIYADGKYYRDGDHTWTHISETSTFIEYGDWEGINSYDSWQVVNANFYGAINQPSGSTTTQYPPFSGWLLNGNPLPTAKVTLKTEVVPVYATDIILKGSYSNFEGDIAQYIYSSIGNDDAWYPAHDAADTSCRIRFTMTSGHLDKRAHYGKDYLLDSLSTYLAGRTTPQVLIYPSLETTGSTTDGWINTESYNTLSWSYILIDGINGPELDSDGNEVWRATDIIGWSSVIKNNVN